MKNLQNLDNHYHFIREAKDRQPIMLAGPYIQTTHNRNEKNKEDIS